MTAKEKLAAYVDGELSAEEGAQVRAAVALDEDLQERLARERQLRDELTKLYRPALEEEVPERLARLLMRQPAPLALFKRPNSIAQMGWLKNVTAIAASLVLGLFLGQNFVGPGPDHNDFGAFVADEQLAHALETQLASSQTLADLVQIGITFINLDGQPCRTYETPDSIGLACRSGPEWQLKFIAPGSGLQNAEYQQASSSSELVMLTAQELLAEGPMDAVEEKQARDTAWSTDTL